MAPGQKICHPGKTWYDLLSNTCQFIVSNLLAASERSTSSATRVAHRMFAESSCDIAMVLTADGTITYASAGAQQRLGDSIVHQNIYALTQDEGIAALEAAIPAALRGELTQAQLTLSSTCGDDVAVQARVFFDLATKSLWLTAYDLSHIRRVETDLRHIATHDHLTGLPNRALLNDRIEWHISEACRNKGLFATVALDLDGFKKTNDALGHLAGDELLKEVATRLRGCLREVDTVSRTGGDEFVLILAGLNSPAEATLVCQRVLDAIRRPILIQGTDVYVSASLGIAVFPEHGTTVAQVMQHADQAMYQSKHQGKNRISFYEPELAVTSADQISLEGAMHSAIRDGEFMVYYQPLVAPSGEIKGCEALMRWRRPDGKWVPPSEFIPIAESNGLITLLGDYVLRAAAMQLRRFDEAGLPGMYVSVNVSPRQLRHPDFEKNLKRILDVTGIDPNRLVLELTESLLMSSQERTQALLRTIAASGVRFSLDDFGTGYSCLAYLKTYPISALKVDRSFIIGIETDEVSRSIVEAIINLARALKLNTVVEGIETREQADAVIAMNVDYLQGYLFARPMAPEELIQKFAVPTLTQ